MVMDMSDKPEVDLPPLGALFVVYFDKRKGYTLGWHQNIPAVQLEDVVEYKSLPSGLHSLKEDVIYFTHDDYAGVSAFANSPAEESQRNAVMFAVGALVPLSMGRLGRSWRHVPHLKGFASKIMQQKADLQSGKIPLTELGQYWSDHQMRDEDRMPRRESPVSSPLSIRIPQRQQPDSGQAEYSGRMRSSSGLMALESQTHQLPPSHPALSLPEFYDVLGPLIFPLYRAALLRKRILLVSQAPIQRACHFVYDLSLLADIPGSVFEALPDNAPASRSRLLFAVGIHDIPLLENLAKDVHADDALQPPSETAAWRRSQGWLACTTDEILASRRNLYDVIVHLPAQANQAAARKQWARIESSAGGEIRATQRDLRRHILLQRSLQRFYNAEGSRSPSHSYLDPYDLQVDDDLLEPLSWPALTYTSFMWWASAGEEPGDIDGDAEEEEPLLEGFSGFALHSSSTSGPLSAGDVDAQASSQSETWPEMALIAYFRRLTATMLTSITDFIEGASVEDNEGTAGDYHQSKPLQIRSADICRLGLDVWSAGDVKFAEELTRKYFGIVAEAQGAGIECCGIRVC